MMKIYVEERMMGRKNYPLLISEFPEIEIVNNFDAKDIEAMVIMNSTLKTIDVDEFPKLKWIQLLMAGYDNVDVEGLKHKGITVSNARDIFSITIAEDVISKMLFFNRNTDFYIKSMQNQEWKPISKEPEIFGSVVSILGTGSIGQELAKRLKAFGTKKILGYKRTYSEVPNFDEIYTDNDGLNKIIRQADYFIIALPLTEETYKMINKEKLQLLKESAVLINVARGDIIDQEALIEHLKSKKIRGAGLDVTSPEPLPKEHELWTLDNVYITPHNASSSPYMKERLYNLTKENIKRFIENQELKYLL
jgi:D-2-hydroxyacid dehydrogenase (NADP+)